MKPVFSSNETGRLKHFLDPKTALVLAVSVGVAYDMPRPFGPLGFQRLGLHRLIGMERISRDAWARTQGRYKALDLLVSKAHDQLLEDYEIEAAVTQKLFWGLGLQAAFFRHRNGTQDILLAISGQNDFGTLALAGKHMLRRAQSPKLPGHRLQAAFRFATKFMRPDRQLWIAAHSTGAVEGGFAYLELIRRGLSDRLAGCLFLNPLNSTILKRAANKAKEQADSPPIYLITSQPSPKASGTALWRYRLDFERWVTGVWQGQLPEVSRTLHFVDPSYHPYDGHAFATSCRVLASMT